MEEFLYYLESAAKTYAAIAADAQDDQKIEQCLLRTMFFLWAADNLNEAEDTEQ